MQAQITGTCLRHVMAPRERKWQIGGQFFHEFTGDALAARGLLESVVYRYDGGNFDRFNPVYRSMPQQNHTGGK